MGKDAGVGPTYATSGNDSTSSESTGSGAPTAGYAGSVEGSTPGDLKPKGKNLTETNDLEGKTAFGEIGTENDPARQAEQKLQLRDAQSGADAGYTKDSSNQPGTNPFSAVGDETA